MNMCDTFKEKLYYFRRQRNMLTIVDLNNGCETAYDIGLRRLLRNVIHLKNSRAGRGSPGSTSTGSME